MSQELKINKGVELMLRRDTRESEPEQSGIKLKHQITLLGRTFTAEFNFTWEGTH
tara:strand:- start:661 stop:825 length:165 start_codon:yes stop_codon:yes gene_type:complete